MRDAGPLCQFDELWGALAPLPALRRRARRLDARALTACGLAGLVVAVLAAAWPVGPDAHSVALALRQEEGRRWLGWMAAQGQLADAGVAQRSGGAALPEGWIVACVQPEPARAFVAVPRSPAQVAPLCEQIAFDAAPGQGLALAGPAMGLQAVIASVRPAGTSLAAPGLKAALVFDPRDEHALSAAATGPAHHARGVAVAVVLIALLLLAGRQVRALNRLAARVRRRRPEQALAWARSERAIGRWVSAPVAEVADALGDEIVRRQHALERSAEALQLLRASWELSADGILLVSLDGVVTYRNPAALRLLRASPEDAPRDGVPLTALLPGLSAQRLADLIGDADPAAVERLVLCSFGGELRPFELRVRPVVTDGEPAHLLHLCPSPVVPGAAAASRPQPLVDTLHTAAQTLERELALPMAALRAELELRSPARAAAPAGVPHGPRPPLQQVRTLLRDYFDLSRAEADRLQLERVAFDVGQQAARCVADHQPLAVAKGLKLGLRLPAARVVVQGDPRRFAQVLGCLLEHAIQIAGGGLLAVQLEAQELVEDAPLLRVSLRLSGSGAGLPAEGLALPESPLAAALGDGPSQGPAGQGSAISLALCHHLCRAMNGGLGAEHNERQGGSIRMWIDALPAEGAAGFADTQPMALQPLAGPLRGRRALIVDDNPLDRSRLSFWLQREGMLVQQVPDGEAALQALSRTPIDIVVTDLSMPGMDGLQATRRMRSQASSEELPIVGVSAYVLQSDAVTCVQLGMNAFLGKPVNRIDLVRTLADLLPQG